MNALNLADSYAYKSEIRAISSAVVPSQQCMITYVDSSEQDEGARDHKHSSQHATRVAEELRLHEPVRDRDANVLEEYLSVRCPTASDSS